jgi:hypothetical protein
MGTPEGVHQPQGIGMIRLGIVDPEDALRTMVHHDQVDFLRNLFIGLLPGDGFKTISHPLERTLQSIRII